MDKSVRRDKYVRSGTQLVRTFQLNLLSQYFDVFYIFEEWAQFILCKCRKASLTDFHETRMHIYREIQSFLPKSRQILKYILLDNDPRKRGEFLLSHFWDFSYFVKRFNNWSRSIISVWCWLCSVHSWSIDLNKQPVDTESCQISGLAPLFQKSIFVHRGTGVRTAVTLNQSFWGKRLTIEIEIEKLCFYITQFTCNCVLFTTTENRWTRSFSSIDLRFYFHQFCAIFLLLYSTISAKLSNRTWIRLFNWSEDIEMFMS